MSEKRAAPRIKANIAVSISGAGDFLSATIINISAGGVFIKTDRVLSLDTDLALRIRLPGDREIMEIAGRVAWSKETRRESPAGMGIEFIGISSPCRRKIQAFVESRLREIPKGHGGMLSADAAQR